MDTSAIVFGAGQAGIAAALALQDRGLRPLVLEAGDDTAGSWPHYYDSLRLFTPAHLDGLPGRPFPGDPNRYPTRDEVADYLRHCAKDLTVRTGQRVHTVARTDGGYRVLTTDGAEFTAPIVVAATGMFGNPHRPAIPALDSYTGQVLHSADYRSPEPFAGQRVVVVGSGNSAVQIAVELASHAEVTLAARTPLRYATTEPIPADSRFWRVLSLAARLPVGRFFHSGTIPVIDTNGYKALIDGGHLDVTRLFTAADGTTLQWADRRARGVDSVVLATGFRPALQYLDDLITFDASGFPAHRHGVSTTHPGLAFIGLEYQRSILSGTLHGVGRDSRYLAHRLTRDHRRSGA
ncbi:FAD-dependent oxidoreductase [Nocardia cyriacigeorgica]|uniref:FAD-dependent oxidoreductase n=1 Tax=Nocardia cyriacigeorgica TaxID=135487 RepID=A0A5R8PE36_9NOCA|nr:NAD(P)-binding domain-containing protein [Nocardia cyriacigeorgica]TLG10911.1 FAD-dependent oxidoreductase [Nocardia cyriacigeorgica]